MTPSSGRRVDDDAGDKLENARDADDDALDEDRA